MSGYIGVRKVPTPDDGGGMWRIGEQAKFRKDRIWPILDKYFSIVSLLLHFNGANNSTTFTDSSVNNHTITKSGDTKISTTQSKFGGSSANFDGTGDYLSVPITSQTSLGATYTIECWIYPANTTGTKAVYGVSVSNIGGYAYLLFYLSGSSLGFYVRPATGGVESGLAAGTVSANTWSHIAISVNNGSARLFINGSQVGSTTTVSAMAFTPVYSFIGAEPIQGYYFNGYIDDFRITKGVARYTENFTVPDNSFSDNS